MVATVNRIVKTISEKSLFDDASALVDSSISFKQGDLLVLDTTAHKIKAVAAGELGTNFLGISRQTIVNGKPLSPYVTDVDASQAVPAVVGPVYGVIAKLVLKLGDALVAGGLVYVDAANGTHHVTATAGSSVAIGVYQGSAIASAVAGQEIPVLLKATYFDC